MKSINRIPVVQQVVDSLKEYIQSEKTMEGDKLPTERELCEELQVGRSTLREAFRILQAKGFVEIKPGRGAFVGNKTGSTLSEAVDWLTEHEIELLDYIEVRMAIETLAVRLAIQRVTDADIRMLKEIHQSFLNAVNNNDSTMVMLLDEQFHNTIVAITKNKLLISINKQVSSYFRSFRHRTFQIPQNMQNAIEPHTGILEAIISKDIESGVKRMAKHLEKVCEDLESSKDILESK